MIENTSREGDFVHENQTMAIDEDFRNVSKLWWDKTIPIEDIIKSCCNNDDNLEDFQSPLNKFEIDFSSYEEGVVLHHSETNEHYNVSDYLLSQLNTRIGFGKKFFDWISEEKSDKALDIFNNVLKHGFERLKKSCGETVYYWRSRNNTMRAMLSDMYGNIPNQWFLEALKEILPGCRMSHWRGDTDTIYGNVLIPDSIRAESDSEYGGMLSISNSEIGQRSFSVMPSTFRAICMNGCIWGQEKGTVLKKRHKTNRENQNDFKLRYLRLDLEEHIDKQIPLLKNGIDMLLKTKDVSLDNVRETLAQISMDMELNKSESSELLAGWEEEGFEKSLFGVVNAITRASQKWSPDQWVIGDRFAGELVTSSKKVESLVSRAKSLTTKDVDSRFIDSRISA